jgi:hypothetical protein
MTITKTAIGNYLRKQPNGDVGMYRNGFKDGVAWTQKRLAAQQMHKATRDYKQPMLTEDEIYEALEGDVEMIAETKADQESWGVIMTMARAIEKKVRGEA